MPLPAAVRDAATKTPWAQSGDKLAPDDSSLTPPIVVADGWPSSFSSTETPRRRVFNWLFNRLFAAAHYQVRYGVLPWDAEVDYLAGATVQSGQRLWRATVATGPGTSNATDPAASGQVVWAARAPTQSAPSAPDAPSGTTSNGAVRWQWNCPLDGGSAITAFTLQWRQHGGSWSSTRQAATTHPVHALAGLTNGTAYEARVKAANANGESGWSATGSATPVASVPDQVRGLRADAADDSLEVSWSEPDDNGASIASYDVQWRSGIENWDSAARQRSASGLSDTIPGLSNGTAYSVRVRARNSAGAGAWSAIAQGTPAEASSVPAAPAAPTVRAIGATNWVAWGPPDSDGPITHYDLRWRIGSGDWTQIDTIATGSYRHAGLTAGSAYEYSVRAVNAAGDGAWSAGASKTVPSQGAYYRRTAAGSDSFNWPWDTDRGLLQVVSDAALPATRTVNFTGIDENINGGFTDGTTFWIVSGLTSTQATNQARGYVLATGARNSSRDFIPRTRSRGVPEGGFHHDGTLYVVYRDGFIAAHNATTLAEDRSKDIGRFVVIGGVKGAMTDGTTVWVVNLDGNVYYAPLATGVRSGTFNVRSRITGCTTDGETLWFVSSARRTVEAYDKTGRNVGSRNISSGTTDLQGAFYWAGYVYLVDQTPDRLLGFRVDDTGATIGAASYTRNLAGRELHDLSGLTTATAVRASLAGAGEVLLVPAA